MTRIPIRSAADNGAQSQSQSQSQTEQAWPRPRILRVTELYIVLEDYIGITQDELVVRKGDILHVCGFLIPPPPNGNSPTGMAQPVAHAGNLRNEQTGSVPLSHIRRITEEDLKTRDIQLMTSYIAKFSYESATVEASTAAAEAALASGHSSSTSTTTSSSSPEQIPSWPEDIPKQLSRPWGSLEWKAGDLIRIYTYPGPDLRPGQQVNIITEHWHFDNRELGVRSQPPPPPPSCGEKETRRQGSDVSMADKKEEFLDNINIGIWYIFGYNLRTGQFGYFEGLAYRSDLGPRNVDLDG